MASPVIYDACVLYPAPLRDLLLRLALAGLVTGRWSDRILDECFESILRRRPGLVPADLARTRHLMNEAVPDCLVTGSEGLEADLDLPDPDDRHVLAAAIRSGATVIVTANVRDFPRKTLASHGVEAVRPDEFVLRLIASAPETVLQVITEQAAALKCPPRTVAELLETLQDGGLERSAAKIRELLEAAGSAGEGP